jgi:hypothetical protein
MARIRSAKPELLEDEKAGPLPHDTWRLFVSTWLLADDYGNLRASPLLIHGAVFWAHQGADVARMLRELGDAGMLTFYTVRGQRYAHVNGWEKHQKVDHPGKPLCPGADEKDHDSGRTDGGGGDQRSTDSADPRETLARTSRLTGTGTGTGTKERTRTKDQETSPPVRAPNVFDQLLGGFRQAWSAKYHEPYTPTPADRSQLGRLLQALKTPEDCTALPALFDAYLRDDDAFVVEKQRHSLAFFCTSGGLNKYRTQPPAQTRPRGKRDELEARNNAAAESVLHRHGVGGGANGRG